MTAVIYSICAILAGVMLIGAIVVAIACETAPSGYEDETGFHYD